MNETNNTPGTLKVRAIAVIEILEHAQCRTLNAKTIARKLGEPASATTDLLVDMEFLGLVESYRGAWGKSLPEPWAARTWSLKIQTAQRKQVRS